MAPTPTLVDTIALLHDCLADIAPIPRPAKAALLAVDIEGVKLGRDGRICIVQVWASESQTIWLVDVTVLGAGVFDEVDEQGRSLRGIFEGSRIRKLFYDVRSDSDALFNLHGILLQNVYDVQLLEVASRRSRSVWAKMVMGLRESIETYLTPPPGWLETKDAGAKLFTPEKGGSYEVFERRPLDPVLIKYCAQDVALLVRLVGAMRRMMGPEGKGWEGRVLAGSKKRVALAQNEDYSRATGKQKALAPKF